MAIELRKTSSKPLFMPLQVNETKQRATIEKIEKSIRKSLEVLLLYIVNCEKRLLKEKNKFQIQHHGANQKSILRPRSNHTSQRISKL